MELTHKIITPNKLMADRIENTDMVRITKAHPFKKDVIEDMILSLEDLKSIVQFLEGDE